MRLEAMAANGLRVIGFAYQESARGERAPGELPEHPGGLVFLGLQGMIDPPRDEVKDAIRGCQEAGIRVVMITGDHAVTGLAIGTLLGIAREGDQVLSGADLDKMDDDALSEAVGSVPVYARVSPQHKLRIVQTLQGRGEVVAVTGDGVNDAPALKAANIGVAMGPVRHGRGKGSGRHGDHGRQLRQHLRCRRRRPRRVR